jgi:hypothetical protein
MDVTPGHLLGQLGMRDAVETGRDRLAARSTLSFAVLDRR